MKKSVISLINESIVSGKKILKTDELVEGIKQVVKTLNSEGITAINNSGTHLPRNDKLEVVGYRTIKGFINLSADGSIYYKDKNFNQGKGFNIGTLNTETLKCNINESLSKVKTYLNVN